MQGKIALAGGGSAEDSRLLDEVFASWIGTQGKLLYLPVALRGLRSYDTCLEWIMATFAPLKIHPIRMWTDLAEHDASELAEFAGVYIGGGNTYSLLAQFRDSGFDRHLAAYTRQGGVVYGGSAGAALLGKDIRTVSHLDRNDVGLTETQGLNLAGEHAVWVHYQPQDDARIAAHIHQVHQPVLAISERSGVVIEKGAMRSAGFEPAYRFDETGKYRL